ncbi:uncharacterized protein JCM6883_002627 [Sporobolomyces salmoneus]|uniref:uncharacterized protein n=1 Tax=Sporobolomyces salmoneus TaxID=183962 RepID=UPI003175B18B
MPVPFLPTEVIAEIVSHLRTPVEQPVNDSIADGRSISLVCRRLAPIGQALRWRLVKIDPSSIHSLAHHFQQFPHLAKLVRNLIHRDEHKESDGTLDTDARPLQTESLHDFVQVFKSTSLLTRLEFTASIQDISSPTFDTIVQTMSALPRLRRLEFTILEAIQWTLEVATAFRTGFPSLDFLSVDFEAHSATPEVGLDTIALSTPRKKLETFEVYVVGTGTSALALGTHLFNELDSSVLRRCHLAGHLVHDVDYKFLSTCPRLTCLTVEFRNSLDPQSFAGLIKYLANFQSLESVRFVSEDLPVEASAIVDANVALKQVLASFPTTLRTFSTHLRFNDYQSIPPRQIPESRRSRPIRFDAFRPDGGGYGALIAWKDETEEECGGNWYRSEPLGSPQL